ncbi:uncharacterized protein BDZ99DRAFT_446221 [Mytilinidion resinicola]|uniref:BZIP domain-containing protein n=1 Tax=Mytilinidion resinicola TaxID=574789 RepID=A0A6A6YIJ6_9PEZI|nr:uncharacterized protein BDZ99DRAFT_446221 [Mytilinidion resinicola]KAF2808621.1 hypothetical protein BDZ99DRAFT_446221 [Mytilinidion resinicola]
MLTSPPNYSPSDVPVGHTPFHVPRQFPSEGLSMGSHRRGSSSGLVSVKESMGHWPSAGSESAKSQSPLANFGFFKSLTSDKKTTRDGQTPKRRGPKPDSKPALTRRQELNRQAQRTHRERKEMYIKALEQEVLRLKDTFGTTARERDAMAEENRRLKEILIAHGISFDLSSPGTAGFGRVGSSNYGSSSTGSISGSYGPGSNSTGYTSPPSATPQNQGVGQMSPSQHPRQQPNNGMDYDQVGIDFVLTLERPCMDHMQMLMVRASDSDADVSGHALMATCPPESHIVSTPNDPYPHRMPDITMPDLLKLLDLSNRLPLDGEITPIMAWAMIMKHERFFEITREEFEAIKGDLLAKVRCYGFGAVLEEFEVHDALMAVSAAKSNVNMIMQ